MDKITAYIEVTKFNPIIKVNEDRIKALKMHLTKCDKEFYTLEYAKGMIAGIQAYIILH